MTDWRLEVNLKMLNDWHDLSQYDWRRQR